MQLWQDVIYSFRSLRQRPGLTAAAVLALALGTGANTAIFSAVNAVLIHSAPLERLRDPSRLVMIWEANPAMMEILAHRAPPAIANIREWKRESRSFEGIAAFRDFQCILGSQAGSHPEEAGAIAADSDFFWVLGIHPSLGRPFSKAEARTNPNGVAMVSASLYQRRFHGDPNLKGKTIRVDGLKRSIVGVMPKNFEIPAYWAGFNQSNPQVWIPLDLDAKRSEAERWMRNYIVYARLRPGVTAPAAQAELRVLGRRMQKQFPHPEKGFSVNVYPISLEDTGPDLRLSLFVLQIAAGFVLLIACANVANLLLARGVSREREIAVRVALGASRGQIFRLILTESLLVGLLGSAAGLLLACWSIGGISAFAPADTHGFHELRLDPLVLSVTFVLSILTGIAFGLAPAFHAIRQNLNDALGKSSRSVSGGSRWLRNSMVTGEVALSLVLLVGAGLMIRSLLTLRNVNPGFRAANLLTFQINLAGSASKNQGAFCRQLLDDVQRLPGVQSASLSDAMPMETVRQTSYDLADAPKLPENGQRITDISSVTETFFPTMDIPLLRGRNFTREEAEAKKPAAIVVSEYFARLNWPNQNPLGKTVILSIGDSGNSRLSVIGVAGNTREMGPDSEINPEVYLPSRSFSGINLAIRTAGDPSALQPAVEKIVWTLDPQQPIHQARSMRLVIHKWLGERRFYMTILGGFSALALLLASVGLYGVLAYVVSLRTRELGIRMALGAGAREVLSLVVGQGLKLALAGIAIGLACAFALTRLMRSLIYGVSAKDPLAFLATAALLVLVSAIASYIPARRASKIDPAEALRLD